MEDGFLLLSVLAAAAVTFGAILWWRSAHRKSPAERERARRLMVNKSGRLTDGTLLDSPSAADMENANLIFYRYCAAGVEYSTAQDVSTLRDLMPPSLRAGMTVAVKYDPRAPSNSIILCEDWSGLRDIGREEAARRHDHSAA